MYAKDYALMTRAQHIYSYTPYTNTHHILIHTAKTCNNLPRTHTLIHTAKTCVSALLYICIWICTYLEQEDLYADDYAFMTRAHGQPVPLTLQMTDAKCLSDVPVEEIVVRVCVCVCVCVCLCVCMCVCVQMAAAKCLSDVPVEEIVVCVCACVCL